MDTLKFYVPNTKMSVSVSNRARARQEKPQEVQEEFNAHKKFRLSFSPLLQVFQGPKGSWG